MKENKLFLSSLLALSMAITACGGGGGGGGATVGPVEGATFTSTALGGVAGTTFSAAIAVNNNGMVVGVSNDGNTIAAKWNAATPTLPQVALLPLAGGAYSAAYGVNDADIAVGEAENGAGGAIVAVGWAPGTTAAVALDRTGLTGDSAAYGINGTNAVVGEAEVGANLAAVIWPTPTAAPTMLTHLTPANPGSSAYAINNGGMIVGESRNSAGQLQAVAWTPTAGVYGAPLALAALPGQVSSTAFSVDLLGNIVGEAELAGGVVHGVVWSAAGAVVSDLGAATSAQAINNTDRIVGHADAGVGSQAAIWNRLNVADRKLLAPISQAFGVNNTSVVVGVMNNQAFIAKP